MSDPITKQFIREHRECDTHTLALQAERYPNVDIREAIVQIEGWQTAKHKLPEWAATDGIVFPPRLSMEQCSSETTALYKASVAHGETLADLTGGFGIDCSYMARNFNETIYVERNPQLCDIARTNFARLGLGHIKIMNGECEDFLSELPTCDWIFLDPARRDGEGRKVSALADCTPCVTKIADTLLKKSRKTMIKCSPMLDIAAACAELTMVKETHIVAVNNECKELLFVISGDDRSENPQTHCINFTGRKFERFTFTRDEESNATITYATEVGKFLYEPNVALQKAGCTKLLARTTKSEKLHPNSNLFTSSTATDNFPGRCFKVEEVFGFSKNDIKRLAAISKANITVRNFPDSVQRLRARLKLREGGDNYIFATTLADERKVLVLCRKI